MGAAFKVKLRGMEDLTRAIAYLDHKSGPRIARALGRKMALTLAQGMRRFVPPTIARGAMMPSDKGIGSRGDKSRISRIKTAKAGVAVGAAFKHSAPINTAKKAFMRRGAKRKGVGVNARNLHWFGAGTADRYTGSKRIRVRGKTIGRESTGNPVKFVGRINKAIWGNFVQNGARAMHTTAIAEAQKLFKKMLAGEANAARTGSVPLELEIGD